MCITKRASQGSVGWRSMLKQEARFAIKELSIFIALAAQQGIQLETNVCEAATDLLDAEIVDLLVNEDNLEEPDVMEYYDEDDDIDDNHWNH